MGLFSVFVSRTRKPEGFLGKLMFGGMNSGHAKPADWGFDHLPAIAPAGAVDLGCSGGRNADELLKRYPKAHVTAVDHSGLSVEKAKAYTGPSSPGPSTAICRSSRRSCGTWATRRWS